MALQRTQMLDWSIQRLQWDVADGQTHAIVPEVCCSSQSWILMFRSVNLHLMTLHKTLGLNVQTPAQTGQLRGLV